MFRRPLTRLFPFLVQGSKSAQTSATVNASPLTGSYTIPTPSVFRGVTVSPAVLTGTYSIPTPSVVITGGITILPSPLLGVYSMPSPGVYKGITFAASPITGVFSMPQPTISIFTPSTAKLSRIYISLNL